MTPERKLIHVSREGTNSTIPVQVSHDQEVLETIPRADTVVENIDTGVDIVKKNSPLQLVEHTLTFRRPTTTNQKNNI